FRSGLRDPLFAQRKAGLGNHNGHHRLTEIAMRCPDHRTLGDTFDLLDDTLDLGRIDIEAARDDEILVAPDYVDVALVILEGEVTRHEETVGAEFGGGLLG